VRIGKTVNASRIIIIQEYTKELWKMLRSIKVTVDNQLLTLNTVPRNRTYTTPSYICNSHDVMSHLCRSRWIVCPSSCGRHGTVAAITVEFVGVDIANWLV